MGQLLQRLAADGGDAFHEDGLADSVDGFGGSHEREQHATMAAGVIQTASNVVAQIIVADRLARG